VSRASVSVTFAVGSLHRPDHFACLHSGSVAEHSLNAPCPLRDRPCRAAQLRPGETLPHFRGVRQLCCDRCLPCRFHKFSSQRATTRRTPSRSQKSRNGVMRVCRKFHQNNGIAIAFPSSADHHHRRDESTSGAISLHCSRRRRPQRNRRQAVIYRSCEPGRSCSRECAKFVS
jgi:hypothetical protein